MNILITGGTGFVGTELCKQLLARGDQVTVISRDNRHPQQSAITLVQDWSELPKEGGFDCVVNLAGAPIADKRWSSKRKATLRASRIGLTRSLVEYLKGCAQTTPLLINASAVGFYGNQGDEILTEDSTPLPDFAHQLCADWETEAMALQSEHTRVCILRLGLVLGHDGGMLKKLAPMFRLGLGGRLGDGQQWMSWVHRQDVIQMIIYLMAHPVLNGVFNATSPNPATNAEFSNCLASQFNKKANFPVPAWVLKTALGEMSTLLLGGQRVIPQQILDAGYQFQYAKLEHALAEVCQ